MQMTPATQTLQYRNLGKPASKLCNLLPYHKIFQIAYMIVKLKPIKNIN